MAMTGMDINEVRQLAAQMTHAAGEIRQLAQTLTNQLQAAPWMGPDREHFVSEWTSSHMSQLNQVVQALESASQQANQNAQQQEAASNG